MASIFSKVNRIYNGGWNVVERTPITGEFLEEVESNVVVDSDYGKSVKLMKTNGQMGFIPLSNTSRPVAVGETLNLEKCFLLTLARTGDADIYRIEVK